MVERGQIQAAVHRHHATAHLAIQRPAGQKQPRRVGEGLLHPAQHEYEQDSGLSFDYTACLLQDESAGGIAIECGKGHNLGMNVGEVAAFQIGGDNPAAEWNIGVIRWLRVNLQDDLELGIRILADDALPVATRGVRGVGKGGEYFRSLLIPDSTPASTPPP